MQETVKKNTGIRIEDELMDIEEIKKTNGKKMKDSGVEWIGEIPEDWEVQNLKSILAERKENNNPIKTDFILSLTNDRGVIPYTEKGDIGNKSKDDLTGYKLAYPNDIVLNSMNVIIGSVGLSEYFGAVSPVYYMLYPRKEEDAVEFFNYVFQTKVFQESLKGYGNGIMEHRLRIPMINLNTVMLPYPTAKEQQKIVNFLDRKVSLIDDTIEKTKQSIEDYKKYKQALITETVTKGLNPDVEMKDSGVEWIGEVPEHWEIVKLKNIGVCFGGIIYNPVDICDEDKGTLVLRSSNVQNGKLDFSDNVYVKTNISDKYITKRGDILVCSRNGSRNLIGKNALIDKDYGYTFGAFMTIVRTKYYKFVHYFLNSNIFDAQSSLFLTSTVNQLTLGVFNNMNLVLPSEEEQQQIVDYLDNKCSEIDKIISEKEQLVKDLEIYKKSLIYECVTGKRQV